MTVKAWYRKLDQNAFMVNGTWRCKLAHNGVRLGKDEYGWCTMMHDNDGNWGLGMMIDDYDRFDISHLVRIKRNEYKMQ